MILITKNEAFKMRELGCGEDVHRTYSKHPKYYLTENKETLKLLHNYRKSIICER